MPKTLLIDLDGVLNTYCGNYKETEISPLREGAREFLEDLSQSYRIEIFTVRDIALTQVWLEKNNLACFVSDITNIKKPYTSVIIDDRAICFNGDYSETFNAIKDFKPFWQNITKQSS